MNAKDKWNLIELAERYADGRLSEAEATALDERLKTDAEARRVFAEALHLGAELRHESHACLAIAPPAAPALKWWRYAAAIVLSLGIGMALSPRPQAPVTVATLTKAQQCQWAGSSLPTVQGARLSPGTLDLIEGLATVKFDSGAELVLEAPATVEVTDAMNCRLVRGTIVADVPPSAIGFTVDTDDAKVVDYGTKFGVSTGDDGKYMVQVLEGLVEVNHKASKEVKQLRQGQNVDHGWYQSRLNPDASEDAEPSRWRPDVIPQDSQGWQLLSTAFGRGKDSYIQAGAKAKSFGDDPFFRVKHSSQGKDLNRKGYVGFDLGKFQGQQFSDAELVLTIEPSDLGYATLVPDSTFAVYGLTAESDDDWEELGLSWQQSPAHDPNQVERHLPSPTSTVLLGKFEIAQGISKGTRNVRSPVLTKFLNEDTNGLATFIICRETDENGRNGLAHAFATKEGGRTPPLLRLKVKQFKHPAHQN